MAAAEGGDAETFTAALEVARSIADGDKDKVKRIWRSNGLVTQCLIGGLRWVLWCSTGSSTGVQISYFTVCVDLSPAVPLYLRISA